MKLTSDDLGRYRIYLQSYSSDAIRDAENILLHTSNSKLKEMFSLDYIASVGGYRVVEVCKNFGDIPEIEFNVFEFGQFENMLIFYLGCLIDVVSPGSGYGVKFNFKKSWERDLFESKLDYIAERLNNENLKYVKCELM